jgi:hypothetical protein
VESVKNNSTTDAQFSDMLHENGETFFAFFGKFGQFSANANVNGKCL